jgi:Helix-turn-helix domain of resolvase
MLGQQTSGIAQIAKQAGSTRQTVYRIKHEPAGAEAALGAWGCEGSFVGWGAKRDTMSQRGLGAAGYALERIPSAIASA